MRKSKDRIIYDNYDIYGQYLDIVRTEAEEDGVVDLDNYPVEGKIYQMDEDAWECAKETLTWFFDAPETVWLLCGTIQRWNGTREGGFTFRSFEEMWNKATEDCDYFRIYDQNGHFYIECSHHDGTNHYEIKRLTDVGIRYLENWENDDNDHRTMRTVHQNLFKRYSTLPHFAHIVYGCPKKEFEAA